MNQAFEEKLQTDLDALKKAGTYKHLRHLTTPMAAEVHMEEAGDVIVLSSNNYLGLADLPEVVEAGKRGLDQYGAGTASVRFICGTFSIHRELEERIAEFQERRRLFRTSLVGMRIPDCLRRSAMRGRRLSPTSSTTRRLSTASGWRQKLGANASNTATCTSWKRSCTASRIAFQSSS